MQHKIKHNHYLIILILWIQLLNPHKVYSSPIQSTVSDSLIEKSIDKLVVYFESFVQQQHHKSIDYKESFSILPVLCKYYGINFKYDEQTLDTLFQISDKRFCLNNYCYMNRIPRYSVIRKNWKNNTDNVDSRTEFSMFCHQLSVRNNDIEILMKYRKEDLYSLTHAAIQMFFIEKNACISSNEIEKYKSILLSDLDENYRLQKWNQENMYDNFSLDIELEIILATLLLSDDLSKFNLNIVLNNQLPDGGFPLENNGIKSSLHSSLIAFWLLNQVLAITNKSK